MGRRQPTSLAATSRVAAVLTSLALLLLTGLFPVAVPAAQAAPVALAAPAAQSPRAADQGGPAVTVSGIQAVDDQTVSAVAAVRPLPVPPLSSDDISVTTSGEKVKTQAQQLLSNQTSLTLVVDRSAQAAESTISGALSGVTTFLFAVPMQALVGVVADQDPPIVLAPPSAGGLAAVAAVRNLHGASTRSTTRAIDLALKQVRPGYQNLVVLYTAARDAGGESAVALAQRVNAAHGVLAVVTTAPDGAFWTEAAQATGGLAISTTPANAIPAFDQLSDGLSARYVVSFPRPELTGTPVNVQVTTSKGAATADVPLPADLRPAQTAADNAAAVPAGGGSSGVGWWVLLLIAVVVLAGMALAVWWWHTTAEPETPRSLRGRSVPRTYQSGEPDPWDIQPDGPAAPPPGQRPARGRSGGRPAEDPQAAPQPAAGGAARTGTSGVRMFDLDAIGTPKEVPGSLFEPRTVRDARRQLEGEEPDEPVDGRSETTRLSRRFEQIKASLEQPPPPEDDDSPQ